MISHGVLTYKGTAPTIWLFKNKDQCKYFTQNYPRILRFLTDTDPKCLKDYYVGGAIEIESNTDVYVRCNSNNGIELMDARIKHLSTHENLQDDLEILTKHYKNLMELSNANKQP